MTKKPTSPKPPAPTVLEFDAKHVVQLGPSNDRVQYHFTVSPTLHDRVELNELQCMGPFKSMTSATTIALGNALIKSAQMARELQRKIEG